MWKRSPEKMLQTSVWPHGGSGLGVSYAVLLLFAPVMSGHCIRAETPTVWNHKIHCDCWAFFPVSYHQWFWFAIFELSADWVSRPFIFHVHNVATWYDRIQFQWEGKTLVRIGALLWLPDYPTRHSPIDIFCSVVEFWSRAMSIWTLSLGWYVVVFGLKSPARPANILALENPVINGLLGFPPHIQLAKSTTSAVKAPVSVAWIIMR